MGTRGLVWWAVLAAGTGCGGETASDGSTGGGAGGTAGFGGGGGSGGSAGAAGVGGSAGGACGGKVPNGPAKQTSARIEHACAVSADGSLWCWGRNSEGQLGNGKQQESNPCPVFVEALGNEVSAVAVGDHHTCARKTDGTVWCWGSNQKGQLGDGTTTDRLAPTSVGALGSQVAGVSLGMAHTCAVKSDGSLWCWGWNAHGQLGTGTTDDAPSPEQVSSLGNDVQTVAAGDLHSCAVKTDGSPWCWGDYQTIPAPVSGLGTVISLGAGGEFASLVGEITHTCAIKTDGTLWCWSQQGVPAQVSAVGANANAITNGLGLRCAISNDGGLWCWGGNTAGQLGDGTTTSSKVPVKVVGFSP